MPYHPDHTTLSLFIIRHLLTPIHLSDVVCSLCRQPCSGQHRLVQITGHPHCQCVFGRSCILGFMRSERAGANTCPGCRVALWNVGRGMGSDSEGKGYSGDGEEEEDGNGSDTYEEEEWEVEEEEGYGSSEPEEMSWTARSHAPTPPSSRSTSSSSSSLSTPPNSEFLVSPMRQDLHRTDSGIDDDENVDDIVFHPSPPPSESSQTLSASSSTSTITKSPITTFVAELWRGTWTLVAAAQPAPTSTQMMHTTRPRSEPVTRHQLLSLIWNIYPFSTDGLRDGPMLEEELAFRARSMVRKHRRSGRFVEGANLGYERRDLDDLLRAWRVVG